MFLATLAMGELLWTLNTYFLPGSIIDLSYNLVSGGPVVLLLYLRYRFSGTRSWHWFGLTEVNERWRFLLAASLAVFALDTASGTVLNFVLHLAGVEGHWTDYFRENAIHSRGIDQFVLLINGIIAAPVLEEILFRGLLYSALREKFGIWISAITSAFIFAAGHFYSVSGFIELTIFGILMALAFQLTRSLIPCIIAHALMNFFSIGSAVALYGP